MTSSDKSAPRPDSWYYSLQSPNKVARILRFSRTEIEKLSETAKKFYSPYEKKKPKPRRIANPQGFLKAVQRRINKRILNKYPFPNYIIGGVKGKDPLEHPFLHIKKQVVITIDVKDCFPSITNSRIFKIWKDRLSCSPTVARLMTKLTTFEGKLPLGSPTSGSLANLALMDCVEKTKKIAEEHQLGLSQYIDDQAISGDRLPEGFVSQIIREFSREGFTINRKKICVMRSGRKQQVTKKNVNQTLSIPRTTRSDVVTDLKKLEASLPDQEGYPKLFNRVNGRITSLQRLHPELSERLKERFGKTPKPLEKEMSGYKK